MKNACLVLVMVSMAHGCGGDDEPGGPDCTRTVCGTGDGGASDAGEQADASSRSDAGPGADSGAAADGGPVSDSGAAADAAVACTGVHPIVGPPRTCERGSCLCVETDACFTVDVADACCDGELQCAPPAEACMATHPIVGPPRTCESGRCYCASPDACFPAETAAGCCAVDVVCVP